MAQTKKTDNSFERDKIDLRINHLPTGEVRVLDCYTGYGLIWKGVKHLTGRDIKTLPIDIRDDDIGFHTVRFITRYFVTSIKFFKVGY